MAARKGEAMETAGRNAASSEWKSHWPLAGTCFTGFFFFSVIPISLSMFMEPLGAEFGWNRTTLSSGIAVSSAITAVLSPFFGYFIDRFGPRKVALPGVVLATVTMFSFSLFNGSWTQW